MIPLLLTASSFLNFVFYIYAIGFVIALGLEQIVLRGDNERNIYIVQSNRKYLWRQTWIVNINWFFCNVGLYLISRNMNTPNWQHHSKKEKKRKLKPQALRSARERRRQLIKCLLNPANGRVSLYNEYIRQRSNDIQLRNQITTC